MPWLVFLAILAGTLFWFNDWVYRLPTPVPANYIAVSKGQYIGLILPVNDPGKPVLLHFFNPDCPCSRFNIRNFKRLYKTYHTKINFVIIAMCDRPRTADYIRNKFGLQVPVLFDRTIAVACGVYSTPQAAVLTANHRLYYRGNYNISRYCTDEKTDFAKKAIISILHNDNKIYFSQLALQSYGCKLPNCNK